jgi:hypothetical protein
VFRKAFTCLYESESGVWGDIISTAATRAVSVNRPSILVGNALFWLLVGGDILEFDFQRLTLAMIEKPTDARVTDFDADWSVQILRGEDNSIGLAILSDSGRIQLWARKSNCDGAVSWVRQNTVKLDELFSRPLRPGTGKLVLMPGYDEDTNLIFLSSDSHDFILQLESMQFSCIGRREYKGFRIYYPYAHFYTAGSTLSLRWMHNEIELLLSCIEHMLVFQRMGNRQKSISDPICMQNIPVYNDSVE